MPYANYIILSEKNRPLIELHLDTRLSWSLLIKRGYLFQCILTSVKVLAMLQVSAAEIILTSGKTRNSCESKC